MKIRPDDDSMFNYLSVKGKAITYTTNLVGPGNPITGPVTASVFTDRAASRDAKELALNFTIAAVSGTKPTLEVDFLVLDPMEPSNGVTGIPPIPLPPAVVDLALSGGKPISDSTTLRFVIANGQAVVWNGGESQVLGQMNVPMVWQVRLTVGGASPSFSLIASYEQRK
jgi:hypothetical protein